VLGSGRLTDPERLREVGDGHLWVVCQCLCTTFAELFPPITAGEPLFSRVRVARLGLGE
jgi:hypothetical protein